MSQAAPTTPPAPRTSPTLIERVMPREPACTNASSGFPRVGAAGRRADLASMCDMPSLSVDGDRVLVDLPGRQAVMAFARTVSVPLADITSVEVVPDGWDLDLGWRVGGTGIPRRLAFGRYRRRGGGRTFAAIYCGQPALVIETTGGDWDRVVLALDDNETAAAQVREAAGLGQPSS